MAQNEQNIFIYDTPHDTFLPGEGWSSFARIYRDAGQCMQLGKMVGIAMLQSDFNARPRLESVVWDFALAADPRLTSAEQTEMNVGMNIAEREYLEAKTGVTA